MTNTIFKKTMVAFGLTIMMALPMVASNQTNVSAAENLNSVITYQTQVQNIGWQNLVGGGELSGTEGQGLRLEGIKINVDQAFLDEIGTDLTVKYNVHVQNIGWQGSVENGELAGTVGQGLRLEAINIDFLGKRYSKYNMYYRVHAENVGWLGWAKAGSNAGTAGYGYRLEAIEIVILDNFETPEGYGEKVAYNQRMTNNGDTSNYWITNGGSK